MFSENFSLWMLTVKVIGQKCCVQRLTESPGRQAAYILVLLSLPLLLLGLARVIIATTFISGHQELIVTPSQRLKFVYICCQELAEMVICKSCGLK
jgi:hypothetical protein